VAPGLSHVVRLVLLRYNGLFNGAHAFEDESKYAIELQLLQPLRQ
jgi:hypothetical protein